jgi:hypothetical protein
MLAESGLRGLTVVTKREEVANGSRCPQLQIIPESIPCMNTILFHCSACKHVWRVPDRMADKAATCPKCGGASGPEGFPYTRTEPTPT